MFVEAVRGAIVESRHRVHVAVVDADGRLVAHAGDPDLVTFMRSVAKPFQALPLVADGVAERFGLTSEDLALACASHSSEPAQVERVRDFLRRVGATEEELLCGPHTPLSESVARDYTARGVRLGPIHSNCSGKHAGMLALARHHGWPTAGYTRPDHPVQQRCLAEVSRWTGVPESAIAVGTDGCGVVCFGVPVRSMAVAYARLGNAEFGMRNAESKSARPFRIPHSAFRITESMLAHPDLIAGIGRPCTEMMTAHAGRVITKVGAEGVYAGLLVREGLGVALKVEDGHVVASALAMAAVLEQLGLPRPEPLRGRAVTNARGQAVGALRVNGGLTQEKDGR
jgi:L-asparaginase II